MRIVYHHRTLGEGAEGVHIEGMINAFRALGHQVEVMSLIPTGKRKLAEGRRRLGRLVQKLPSALYEMAEIAYNLKGYHDAIRVIRQYRPDFVYDRYNLYNLSVVAAARRAKVPVFLEVNTPYAYQRRAYEHLAFKSVAAWMERRTWQMADWVLVVSSPLKQFVQRAGVVPRKIKVLPNGVDVHLFDPSRTRPSSLFNDSVHNKIVIGFVGSLRRWHGLDLLISAAAPILRTDRQLHMIVTGDGPQRSILEEQAKRLDLSSSITFLGQLDHEEIPATIARFDIAVTPNSVFYQSPMKLLEYMAMAKAVVAPNMENVRDLIEPGREGILFTPDDPVSLREALELLARDPALRARLGSAARERVEHQHSWLHNASRVVEMLGSPAT